jgi:hypothetical protein
MTAKRRAALKKAQNVSARKRLAQPNKIAKGVPRYNTAAMGGKKRKSPLGRNVALATVGVGAITTAGVVARHRISGSTFTKKEMPTVGIRGNVTGSKAATFSITKSTNRGGGLISRNATFVSAKHGPIGIHHAYGYEHRKLTREDVLGTKIGRKLVKRSAQPWFESLASQYTPDRGQNRREDPNNPGHNFKGERLPTQNWVYGKRTAHTGARKFIGSTEMFSNIGASGKIKGYTTIGGALTGEKG